MAPRDTPSFVRSALAAALLLAAGGCAGGPAGPGPAPAEPAEPPVAKAPPTNGPAPAEVPAPAPAKSPGEAPEPAPVDPAEALARAERLLAEGSLAEAVEAAREAGEAAKGNPRPWVIKSRAERLLARAAEAAADSTTAQLRLVDAEASARRAVALAPEEALQVEDSEPYAELGRALFQQNRFAEAVEALGKSLKMDRDGPFGHSGNMPSLLHPEVAYDYAAALAYAGRFEEALKVFEAVGARLGPEPRIEINAAICEEKLGKRKEAVDRLAALYAAEVAAGRADGPDAKRALEKTWELTVQHMDFEEGKRALRALEAAHPDRSEPPYMLGNLLSFLGGHAGAVAAYQRATAVAETPAAMLRLSRELALCARTDEAAAAALAVIRQAPGTDGLRDVVLDVARRLAAAAPERAGEFLRAALGAFPDDAEILAVRGDALLAAGDAAAALGEYGRAREADSFSTAWEARAGRAALALLRGGRKSPDAPGFPAVPGAGLDPAPGSETLLDFERPALLLRPLGGARFVDGAARFPPPPADGERVVALHLFPDLDATEWTHVDLGLRAEGGTGRLRIGLADGYDQMGDPPACRFEWPGAEPLAVPGAKEGDVYVEVGAAAAVHAVAFDDFWLLPGASRAPLDARRVKCLVLRFRGAPGSPPPFPCLDSVVLRDARSGRTLRLFGGDEGYAEAGVLFDGSAPPFTRAINSVEMTMDLLPTGTGPVSKAILEDQNGAFDPSMVGRGGGALRVRAGDSGYFPSKKGLGPGAPAALPEGPAAARVVLRPDRDLQRFGALTFLARGEEGGERLRVRLVDAATRDVGARLPAGRWPASIFPRTPEADGALVLGREWRMYRIPFAAYPEIDRSAVAEISFEIGTDVGNPPGARVYLDEIAAE